MWHALHSILTTVPGFIRKRKESTQTTLRQSAPYPSRITIVSLLLGEQDRSLIADICYRNEWEVYFAKTCDEGRQVVDQLKPQIILFDRDLADGNWRLVVSAFTASSGGSCTLLISKVADDYLWNEVVCNGGYDLLRKPLREEEVLRAVKFARSYWNSARQTVAIPRK